MTAAPVAEERVAPVALPLPCPALARAAGELLGRTVWHVNTTATGGGVAELVRSAVAHHTAAGLPSRWLVTGADDAFFAVTKQLHHMLHGSPGHGRGLDAADAAEYARTTTRQAVAAAELMEPGDIVLLHDPQTLGMARALSDAGARVVWRSHIGTARKDDAVDAAWAFLAPHLAGVSAHVFTSPSYVPAQLAGRDVRVVRPSIDPASPKCAPMSDDEAHRVLESAGLEDGPGGDDAVRLRCRVVQDAPLPADADVVLQLSRWDPLKDMRGVLRAFADGIAPRVPAHLVLAGPDPDDVADDKENAAVMADVVRAYEALPADVRSRAHLLVLSLRDVEVNARVVNAVQRRATVVAQKSLEEGFGLAVAEAMLKRRPVVAAAVGGLAEQIDDGVTGRLVDPRDLSGFADAVVELLRDRALAARLVEAAAERCAARSLLDREYAELAELLVDVAADGAG